MTAASPATSPWRFRLPADRLTRPDLVAGTFFAFLPPRPPGNECRKVFPCKSFAQISFQAKTTSRRLNDCFSRITHEAEKHVNQPAVGYHKIISDGIQLTIKGHLSLAMRASRGVFTLEPLGRAADVISIANVSASIPKPDCRPSLLILWLSPEFYERQSLWVILGHDDVPGYSTRISMGEWGDARA